MINRDIANIAILYLEKIVVLSIGFATTILLARSLGPEEFGLYSFILASGFLLLPFTQVGLNNLCGKYFNLYPNNAHHFFKAAMLVRAIFSILAILLSFCLAEINDGLIVEKSSLLLLVLLQSFNCFNLIEFIYLSKGLTKQCSIIRVTAKLLSRTMLLFAVMNDSPLFILVLLTGVEYIFSALGYCYLYFSSNLPTKNRVNTDVVRTAKRLFHQSKWLALSSIASILYLKIDQLMIGSILGNEEVGYYSAALKFSEIWFIFPVVIANVFMTKFVYLFHSSNSTYWRFQQKLFKIAFSICCVLIISIYFTADLVVKNLYGTGYTDSVNVLKIHIFAVIFVFFRAFVSKWLILSKNYNLSLYSHLFGAGINIILNCILIPSYGISGAAIASVFAYFSSSFLFLFLFRDGRSYISNLLQSKD
ncbi:flippase [Pseudoalteromonas xiamenensis]|uniref:flippase n=1 Tax=Pseudoalteromonas xiamenensis TaxID=882626 RepID=UPI0027E4DBEF|nr:flippase [Pseudoalteromonas xiamenensis]WMN61205.1 flippase [Pseudoalteromonas xiamenensis]